MSNAASGLPGLDESALLRAAIHIARPLGLDPATTPIIDARLDDGSRVAICVPPASPHVAITIRRFGKRTFSPADLVEQKALPENVLKAAERMLMTRRNILVSGGTGSGKTTLLNALIELLPVDERIVSIEDTLELRIDHSNCVRFEARGLQEGAVTIRDLVRHALRHRPDHIVVGEVRGGEAADLLQALNTGHGGSLTTVHANNAESALSRIASCAMQGGGELPWEVTCRGVVDGIAMVIHMTRREGRAFRRGSRVRQRLRSEREPMGNRTTGMNIASKLKTKRTARIGIALLVFGMLALITQAQFEPIDATVVRVIDGDTIRVRVRGKVHTVRLIGVDTPETVHPTKTVAVPGVAGRVRFKRHRLTFERGLGVGAGLRSKVLHVPLPVAGIGLARRRDRARPGQAPCLWHLSRPMPVAGPARHRRRRRFPPCQVSPVSPFTGER